MNVIPMKASSTIAAHPAARPSSPSVRFTAAGRAGDDEVDQHRVEGPEVDRGSRRSAGAASSAGAPPRAPPTTGRARSRSSRSAWCAPRSPSERRLHELHVVVGEAEQRARDRRAEHPRARASRSRSGSGTAPRSREDDSPPIVGVPAFWWWPCGPSSRMCWPNSRSRRNSMNFGLRKMQISRAPCRRDAGSRPASSRPRPAPRRRPPRPTPRERLHEHGVAGAQQPAAAPRPPPASATAWVSPSKPRRISAASGPTVTSRSTPALARRARRSRGGGRRPRARARACRRAPPRAAPAARRGKVVDRGAHRHRVGVVGVVDDEHPAGSSRAGRAAPRTRTSSGRSGSTPSARAAATAASRLRRLWACPKAAQLDALAVVVDLRPRRRRPEQPHLAALAEGDRASSARRCGASSGSPAGTTAVAPGARPAISSAFAAAIASSEPSSSRCAGPTLTITPTSGRAIAVSSAIWPGPRIAISRTSARCRAGAARIASGSPISVFRFSRARGGGAAREQRGEDVLGRGLAGRAGDRDHTRAARAPLAGHALQLDPSELTANRTTRSPRHVDGTPLERGVGQERDAIRAGRHLARLVGSHHGEQGPL